MIDIKKLIGESTDYDKKQQLEVKRPKSWLKSVSAFANGRGGALIFGINDSGEIVGVEKPEKTSEQLSELIKQRMDPVPNFRMTLQPIESTVVMIVEVDPGNLTPYYVTCDGRYETFKRIGNESVIASANDLRELVLKGSNKTYDSLISEYDFSKLNFSKLKATFYNRCKGDFNDEDYASWGIVNTNGKLTNAGALIADESPVKHSRIFCTRWNGLTMAGGLMDALDDMEVSGSLISLLQEGMSFCRRNFKKRWYKTPDGRIELPDYPEQSIHEALVNALIHRSYLELGSEVHIDIFDDRLEISSPGGMYESKPVQESDLYHIVSRRRNPVLADIFSRLRFMERRGSGFKKIQDAYKNQENYREELHPEFYSDEYNFQITLWNLNYGAQNGEANHIPTDENVTSVDVPSLSQVVLSLSQVCPKLNEDLKEKFALIMLSMYDGQKSATELMTVIGERNRSRFRINYLNPLIEIGLIDPIIKDSPRSSKQAYKATAKGRVVLS